jgi:hypothetical protein
MKKYVYHLFFSALFSLSFTTMNLKAQSCQCTNFTATSFCDNFNAYALGAIGPQSPCWTTWSGIEGGSEDGTIREVSGNKYMRIQGQYSNGGPQDVVLKLGNRQSGKYVLKFKIYVYSYDKGYFNILNSFSPNSNTNSWLYHVYFDNYGWGRLQIGSTYMPSIIPPMRGLMWFKSLI